MIRLFALLAEDTFLAFSWRVPFLVFLMVLSGILEGLAVTAALPLLIQLGGGVIADIPRENGASIITLLANGPVLLGLPEGPIGVGILMVLLVAASAVIYLSMARLAASMQVSYVRNWQNSIFSATLSAGPKFMDARRDGNVVASIVVEAGRVGGAFYHGCLVLAAIVNLIIYVALTLLVSPVTSFAVMIVGVLLFLFTRPYMRRAFGYGEAITRAQADIQSLAYEGISAIKMIKANVAEDEANTRFANASAQLAHANFQNSFDVQKAKTVFEFGGVVGLAGLLVVGPLFFGVEVSTVLVVLALFVRLLPRVSALQQGLQALNTLLPALLNLKKLRKEANAAAEAEDKRPLPSEISSKAVSIEFHGVAVQRGETLALNNVNVKIPPGKIVALVGPSGSGKSTFVEALLGLVKISSGDIRVDEFLLKELPLPAWRRTIGYVAQETSLLSGSIAANVRLGSAIDTTAVNAALDRAAAHFVRRLKTGIDTEVGDRGARLSGGERQRLGLARAMVIPRRLFVFDEATSALDAETETEVMKTVLKLSGQATVLLVAHRFSTVKDADIIHVFENGSIVESGDWKSLSKRGTRFEMLRELQEMERRDKLKSDSGV